MVWLAHFVHPDGSLGGEYASRNTQTYYPAAFEMLALRLPAAAWISERMRSSVVNGAAVGLSNIDIYNHFPILNNLVFAYLALDQRGGAIAPTEEPGETLELAWYPKAGIARVRRERYDAYVGTAKGGVIKVFDRIQKAMVYSDCGYVGLLEDGRTISSQYQDSQRSIDVADSRIEVSGVFFEVSRPDMNPMRFLGFRIFSLTFGRFAFLGQWLKRYLVKLLIYRKVAIDIRIKRVIEFENHGVRVRDSLVGQDGTRLKSLRWSDRFTTIHMGSSRYFVMNELQAFQGKTDFEREIALGDIPTGVVIERNVCIS